MPIAQRPDPSILPPADALAVPTVPPAPGTRARYAGSLPAYWGAAVVVTGVCACLHCLLTSPEPPRMCADVLDGYDVPDSLSHVRLTSLRVAP